MGVKAIAKKSVSGVTLWGARAAGTVTGARLGAAFTVPLGSKVMNFIGLAQRVGLGVKDFARDTAIGFTAVAGFCVGNALGEYIGKKIG